jgi:hypothetical protein
MVPKRRPKSVCICLRMEGSEDVEKAAHVLKFCTDDGILQQTPFHAVQAKAFTIFGRACSLPPCRVIVQNSP